MGARNSAIVTANVTRISHFQNGGTVGLGGEGITYYTRSLYRERLEAQQDLESQAVADAGAAVAGNIAQVLVQGAECQVGAGCIRQPSGLLRRGAVALGIDEQRPRSDHAQTLGETVIAFGVVAENALVAIRPGDDFAPRDDPLEAVGRIARRSGFC